MTGVTVKKVVCRYCLSVLPYTRTTFFYRQRMTSLYLSLLHTIINIFIYTESVSIFRLTHQSSLSQSIFKYSTHRTYQDAHPRVRIRMQNLSRSRHPLHTRLSQKLLFPLQTEGSLEQTLSQREMLRLRRDGAQGPGMPEAVRYMFQDGAQD